MTLFFGDREVKTNRIIRSDVWRKVRNNVGTKIEYGSLDKGGSLPKEFRHYSTKKVEYAMIDLSFMTMFKQKSSEITTQNKFAQQWIQGCQMASAFHEFLTGLSAAYPSLKRVVFVWLNDQDLDECYQLFQRKRLPKI